jgi:alanine dehydrogenase
MAHVRADFHQVTHQQFSFIAGGQMYVCCATMPTPTFETISLAQLNNHNHHHLPTSQSAWKFVANYELDLCSILPTMQLQLQSKKISQKTLYKLVVGQ